MNQNKHGGKRPNSGAKHKYGEPTKTVTFRIPESKIKDVKKIVADYLKSLIEGSKPY
jgi:hypothetical protein